MPILFFLSQVMIFLQVSAQQPSPAELRSQPLFPAQHCTTITPPRQEGTEEMLNQGSSCTVNTLHFSLDANSGGEFFVYLLFQVLHKASCLLT